MNFLKSCLCPQRQNQQQSNSNNLFVRVSSSSSVQNAGQNADTLKTENLSPHKTHYRKVTDVFGDIPPPINIQTTSPDTSTITNHSPRTLDDKRTEFIRQRFITKIKDIAFKDFITRPKQGGNQAFAVQEYQDKIKYIETLSISQAYHEYERLDKEGRFKKK